MAQFVKLVGYDDCMRGLEKFPSRVLKATKDSMRMAGRKAAAELRKTTPAGFRKLVKSKLLKGKLAQNAYVTIGLYKAKDVKGDVNDWFKAYWKNYGTLTHRDPNHHFKNPIKPDNTMAAKSRRNRVGQPRKNFYEAGLPAAVAMFQKTFEEQMTKQSNDLLKP